MENTFRIKINSRRRTLVDIARFPIEDGKINFLFGESGIGKTLIARSIFGLPAPEDLQIHFNEKSYAAYRSSADAGHNLENGFFVFQEPSSHLNPLMRLFDQMFEGSLAKKYDDAEILRHLWNNAEDEAIRAVLQVYPKPYRPSGGEKQRILLAMAFKKINRFLQSENGRISPLFVFDEPTGNLDNRLRNRFLELLFEKYRRHPFTVLLITHDYSMISEVLEQHADIAGNVTFRELYRHRDQQRCRIFSPEIYTYWLKQQKPMTGNRNRKKRDLLLKVGRDIEVFGKRLVFERNGPSDLEVRSGELVYLKAASGAGKTTVMKIIMGLLPADRFFAQLGPCSLSENLPRQFWRDNIWAKQAGMVFQHADEALNLQARVQDVFKGLPLEKSKIDPRQWLNILFDEKREPLPLRRQVGFLSGGQKQRLNLLRSMALDTPLLLLDEPLNGLDFESIKKVLRLLRDKQREGKGILLVSHNEEIFDKIVHPEHIYYLAGK